MPRGARWDLPRPARQGRRLNPPSIGGLAAAACAERVLRVLSSSKYRKGSLEQMDFARCRASFLATLLRCTRLGTPIQLTLMAFPFKVPNPAKVGPRVLPDLAELAAIQRLRALGAAIAELYPPGLRLDIIHDGALIADVFDVRLDEVRAYEAYFGRLLRVAGVEGRIRCHDFEDVQRRAGLDPTAALDRLRDEATRWWRTTRDRPLWRASFRKTCGMLRTRDLPQAIAGQLLRAANAGSLPSEYASVERRVHEAMIAYRVKNAIIHRFDPRSIAFPDAIHATTRVRGGRLALWLVRRGSSLLPWHGVGAVDEGGRARVMLAEQIADCPDLKGVVVPGEDTPFCYAPSNGRLDLGAVLPV
jgi:hypothetical protein